MISTERAEALRRDNKQQNVLATHKLRAEMVVRKGLEGEAERNSGAGNEDQLVDAVDQRAETSWHPH